MKLNEIINKYSGIEAAAHRMARGDSVREPLKTFDEVAEMFGTDSAGLRHIRLAFDIPFPEPKLKHNANRVRSSVRYYAPSEVKQWVKEVKSSTAFLPSS